MFGAYTSTVYDHLTNSCQHDWFFAHGLGHVMWQWVAIVGRLSATLGNSWELWFGMLADWISFPDAQTWQMISIDLEGLSNPKSWMIIGWSLDDHFEYLRLLWVEKCGRCDMLWRQEQIAILRSLAMLGQLSTPWHPSHHPSHHPCLHFTGIESDQMTAG